MCGIIGWFAYNCQTKEIDPRVEAMLQRMLFMESLVFMEPRGKDATGISLLWDDHETAVIKQPVEVSQFAKDDGLWGEDFTNPADEDANFKYFMQRWLRGLPDVRLRHALGHVRLGTKGSEYNPHNNHPIIVTNNELKKGGDIAPELLIGVHNGGIKNDTALFNQYKFARHGEVDSEVIFRMINEYRNDFTVENLKKTFDELTGAYAVMAYSPDDLDKVACMRHVRPLDGAYIPEVGALVLISEKKFLQTAFEEYERWRIREAGTIVTWKNEDGDIEEIGEVYDLFPYLTVDWYNSIDEGVWVLDLSTEVTDETKCKDLVQVEKIYKPATTTYGTGRNWSAGGHTTANDRRSTTTTTTPTTTTVSKDTSDDDPVEDLTKYDKATKDEGELMDALVAEVMEEEADVEGDTVEIEVSAVSEDDVEEDDESEEDPHCPYSWKERVDMAMDALYNAEEELEDRLVLSSMNGAEIRALLDKYLIKTKDEDEAATIMASFYDMILPEGFALGFGVGYRQATEDVDLMTEGSDDAFEKMQEKIDDLTDALKAKEKALENLLNTLRTAREAKQRSSQYIGLMRPLLHHLLTKSGVADETTGKTDLSKLKVLLKEAGVTQNEAISNRIVSTVLKAKKATGQGN